MAGEKSIGKYQMVPVTGEMIILMREFIRSDRPYQTLLTNQFFPRGGYVSDVTQKCIYSIERIYDKYLKYKRAGVVADDSQKLALGNLAEDMETAKNFEIVKEWMRSPLASTPGILTKHKLMDFLNKWFGYHQFRIGWSSTALTSVTINDPRVKSKDPSQQKRITYSLAERYNSPIKDCLNPYVQGIPILAGLRNISLSVSQSETILLRIAQRYTNDNDLVEFSVSNPDEHNAYIVISTLSSLPTEFSKTLAGVKHNTKALVQTLINLPEERRKRMRLEDIKSEKEALEKQNELIAEQARRLANKEKAEKLRESLVYNLEDVVSQGSLTPVD